MIETTNSKDQIDCRLWYPSRGTQITPDPVYHHDI